MKKNIIIVLCLFASIISYANTTPKYPALFSDENTRSVKVKQLQEKEQKEKIEAEAWARANDRRVRYEVDGTLHEIIRIENGRPIYYITHNVNAAISTSAGLVRNTPAYNLNGTNLIVGVWDGGSVLSTHQEFDSRVTVKDGAASHYHSTHVGGTIGAKGFNSAALGMAPSAKIDSYDWNSDNSEMASRAASAPNQSTKIYVSNHSYGIGTGWRWNGSGLTWDDDISVMYDKKFGMYYFWTREWDIIAYDAPYYLIIKSAGNDRNDNPSNGSTVYYNGGSDSVTYNDSIHPLGDGVYYNGGYDSITYLGIAKNILTVGAVNDAVSSGSRNLGFATMSSFSGWGPADDGRIKPDVVGNGVGLVSCDNGNNSDYTTLSGTSMSAPNVCGSAALLIQHYRNLNSSDMRSSTLKGVIIHTSDDIGRPGPDYSYGWGLMNTKEAADIITRGTNLINSTAKITEELLDSSNPDDEHNFYINGSEPFKTTICWTDPEGTWNQTHNSRTPVLVNDLDLRIISPNGGTNYPFILDVNNPGNNATSGDNIVDNVEQVIINTGAVPGIYNVVVNHKGLSGSHGSQQYYSLIVSGATPIPEPGLFLILNFGSLILFIIKRKRKFNF
ncbi:S8 family serine peptidase [bacterium]|nr:S8 family serine peptidase [bacterium]